MRKKGKLIISCCILFVIMLFIGLAYWILISIPRERMKGCYFGYEQMRIMSNEKYTGKIDAKMDYLSYLFIGGQVSTYKPKKSKYYPEGKQMVLYTGKEKLYF